MPAALIGHCDVDSFYVAAERVRDEYLRAVPVAVLGNQGACVIAKCYQMKAAGVKTGEPIWEAKKKCPDAIYLKRDFRWYETLSGSMLDVVRQFSPSVEYYSIDEAFFKPEPARSLQATAEAIRDRIKREVGVPATVGIARSKTLAKLITDAAKPFGAKAVTDPDAERELLATLPVTDITGIGKRRAARLAPYGIKTCLDFINADNRLIRSLLTVVGERLWYELRGESVQKFHTVRPAHKMISRGGSIGKETADPNVLYAWAVRNLERLVEELAFHQVRTEQLSVWVDYKDGKGGNGRARFMTATDRFDLLLEAVRVGLRQAWRPGVPVSRVHLFASKLRGEGYVQRGLFDEPEEPERRLAKLKREVNAEVGRFALRSGATLYLDEVYRDQSQDFDICDIRGKMCF